MGGKIDTTKLDAAITAAKASTECAPLMSAAEGTPAAEDAAVCVGKQVKSTYADGTPANSSKAAAVALVRVTKEKKVAATEVPRLAAKAGADLGTAKREAKPAAPVVKKAPPPPPPPPAVEPTATTTAPAGATATVPAKPGAADYYRAQSASRPAWDGTPPPPAALKTDEDLVLGRMKGLSGGDLSSEAQALIYQQTSAAHLKGDGTVDHKAVMAELKRYEGNAARNPNFYQEQFNLADPLKNIPAYATSTDVAAKTKVTEAFNAKVKGLVDTGKFTEAEARLKAFNDLGSTKDITAANILERIDKIPGATSSGTSAARQAAIDKTLGFLKDPQIKLSDDDRAMLAQRLEMYMTAEGTTEAQATAFAAATEKFIADHRLTGPDPTPDAEQGKLLGEHILKSTRESYQKASSRGVDPKIAAKMEGVTGQIADDLVDARSKYLAAQYKLDKMPAPTQADKDAVTPLKARYDAVAARDLKLRTAVATHEKEGKPHTALAKVEAAQTDYELQDGTQNWGMPLVSPNNGGDSKKFTQVTPTQKMTDEAGNIFTRAFDTVAGANASYNNGVKPFRDGNIVTDAVGVAKLGKEVMDLADHFTRRAEKRADAKDAQTRNDKTVDDIKKRGENRQERVAKGMTDGLNQAKQVSDAHEAALKRSGAHAASVQGATAGTAPPQGTEFERLADAQVNTDAGRAQGGQNKRTAAKSREQEELEAGRIPRTPYV